MSEKKIYVYNFECFNCQRTIVLKIPFGVSVSKFITETKLAPCIHCGCDSLSLDEKRRRLR